MENYIEKGKIIKNIEIKFFNKKIKSELLNKSLHNYLETYMFIDKKNISKISIGVYLNENLEVFSKIYDKDNLSIIEINTPKILNGKQDIQNRNFIQFCKELDLKSILTDEIKSISIIILYNKSFTEVKIKGLNMEKEEEKDSTMELFVPTIPKYKMSQVILNAELEKEIKLQ